MNTQKFRPLMQSKSAPVWVQKKCKNCNVEFMARRKQIGAYCSRKCNCAAMQRIRWSKV